MPDWVRALPTPKAITDTCKMRVQREVSRYKGVIKEYDVINEPLTGHADWLRKTVGDSILWNCFKWAREADPDAKLYINDYNVEYNWGQAVEYRELIKKIKAMGAPVTGVGIQAHFWDCCRPNVDELVKNLNIIAEAGLPMRLTEYDWGTNLTEKQQVDDFLKVLTVAFSHPSVHGAKTPVFLLPNTNPNWLPTRFCITPKKSGQPISIHKLQAKLRCNSRLFTAITKLKWLLAIR
jgi:GH35 family endo-1,4-beta-xylanase